MKKKISKVSLAAIAAATILSAMPVLGATNTAWSGNVATPGSSIRTGARTKTTTSSVIANYSSGPSAQMTVEVLVEVNSAWKNCTYYSAKQTPYIAAKGINNYIEVKNLAVETYGRSAVKAQFTALNAGTHSGKWRPDYQ